MALPLTGKSLILHPPTEGLVLLLTYDGNAVNNRWRKLLLLLDAWDGKTPVPSILKSDSPGGLVVRRIEPLLKLLHGLEL